MKPNYGNFGVRSRCLLAALLAVSIAGAPGFAVARASALMQSMGMSCHCGSTDGGSQGGCHCQGLRARACGCHHGGRDATIALERLIPSPLIVCWRGVREFALRAGPGETPPLPTEEPETPPPILS